MISKKLKSSLHFGGDAQFNMTPMIDIVFLLIIFFMLICQFIVQENYRLDVPDDCPNAQITDHSYSGFSLNTWVEGFRLLYPEQVIYIHPDDAAQMDLKSGETAELLCPDFEKVMPVWIDKHQNPGTITVLLPPNSAFEPIITPANIRKNNV